MEPNEIGSGAEYAQLVIDGILETEKTLPIDEQMPIDLLTHLIQDIEIKADKYWIDYMTGKRETFMFTDVELEEMFNKAGEKFVSDLLDGMVDKDILEVSIDENGEFLYGLTEKGKEVSKQELKPKRKRKNNGKGNS